MKYFEEKEFECKCKDKDCKMNNMQEEMKRRLDNARRFARTSFVITSGCRCTEHNKAVGGSKTSSHLTGWAVDIRVENSGDKYKILTGLLAAGFNRIGIGSNFIHADCDPKKIKCVTWTY